jgi:hypothetical protein
LENIDAVFEDIHSMPGLEEVTLFGSHKIRPTSAEFVFNTAAATKTETAGSAKTSKQAKNSAAASRKRKYVEESSDEDEEESDYEEMSDSSSDASTTRTMIIEEPLYNDADGHIKDWYLLYHLPIVQSF